MTTEELKALRSRVLDAINRELQPTRMNDEELLKAITALVEREGRGGYLLPIQKMDTVNGIYKKGEEGLPAAHGQKYVLPAAAFLEFRDGKITRVTTYYNLTLWIKLVS